MKRPNLFIVGHPRTGTSALHDFLGQHPDIYMSVPKEPVYFARDLQRDSDRFHQKEKYFPFRTEEAYLHLFRHCSGEKVVGESTAVYLYSKEAAGEISYFNPDAKIIMIFREPISWIISFHSKACQILGEDERDLERALLLEEARKQGKALSRRVMAPSILYYTEFIRFREQIERYRAFFEDAAIKIILHDDFRADNKKVFSEILEFIGADPDFVPDFKTVNVSRAKSRFPGLQRIIQSPAITKRAARLMPRPLYHRMTRFYWENLFTQGERIEISAELKRGLMKRFAPEVRFLGELLQRDLMALWGYKDI